MGRIVTLLILALSGFAAEPTLLPGRCAACHTKNAPPLSLIYRRYLMLYSSKERIQKRMIDFLLAPSKAKSAMPEGMKNRFNPQKHPAFSPQISKKAVETLIEKEDLIPRIVVPGRPDTSRSETKGIR
ncbi:hypothetical protein [Nitratifractor sp.]